MSGLEDQLARALAGARADDDAWRVIPRPVREHVFAPPRRWRFDFAWPDIKVAVEVEGGIWTRGGHSRGAGMVKDAEKYNEAAILGWLLIRVTGVTISNGVALETIERAVKSRLVLR